MCLTWLQNCSLSKVKYLNTHLVKVTNIKLVDVFVFYFLQKKEEAMHLCNGIQQMLLLQAPKEGTAATLEHVFSIHTKLYPQ